MANVGSVGIKAEFIVDKAGLQRDVNSVFRNINMPSMKLDSRQFTEPLGRISRASTEFQRSLDASNARVIAFGASAGIIYSITASFKKLVEVTIEVEKSLADINVIFNLSKRQLVDFSDALFQVASQTGTTFNDVSKAALELSRQGLSVSETLKRTRDALALTRLSGIDATQSVESITAALNAFNNTLIDSTTLVSKLAAVDAKYAVSAGDLAEAFQRVGSTAVDAGVDIDSLVGLVTSAQQITARGGSVIGNALKTIFQRVQRPEVINSLQALNVQVRDLQGNTLSADKILQNLANTYKTLSSEQQNQVTQLAAGVFQANQFKAILNDLGKQNSIFSGATLISRGATDEAIQRIDELRKTTASYINETVNNLKNVGSQMGKVGIEPVIRQVLGVANFGADLIGSGPGKAIGESIMKGLAEFLSGPGLVSIGVLMLKLFGGVANFARQGFAQILESQSKTFRMQEQIGILMGKYPEMQRQILQGNLSQEQVQQRIVQLLQQELATRSSISRVVQATTAGVANQNVLSIGGLKNIISSQNAAKPFLFKDNQLSLNPKRASVGLIPKVQEAVGALRGGYTPGAIRETVIPNFGKVVYNTAEKIKTFPGMKQPAIMPPSYSKAGQNYKKDFFGVHGFNPYAAGGMIPNFAGFPIGQRYLNKSMMLEAIITPTIKGTPDAKIAETRVTFLDKNEGNQPIGHIPITGEDLDYYGGIESFLKRGPHRSNSWERIKASGHIPNFMPILSKQAAFEMLMNNRQKISALTYNSSSLGRPVEVNGLQWSSAVRHDLKTGTRPGNVERQKKGGFITLRGRFDGAGVEEIKNISLDKIQQIRSGGNIYDIANKGLIPNFSNIIPSTGFDGTSRLLKPSTGSLLTFNETDRKLITRYMSSNQKGDARELFATLFGKSVDTRKSIFSSNLKLQTDRLADLKPGATNLEKLYAAWPQMRYRKGLGNSSGEMIDIGGKIRGDDDGPFIKFGSIDEFEHIFGRMKGFNPNRFDLGNVTTTPFSKGLVPNFFEYPTLSQLRKGRPSLQGLLSHASGRAIINPKYLDVDLNQVKGGINYKDKVDLNEIVGNIQSKGKFVLNRGLIPNFSPLSDAVARESKVRPLASIRIGANASLKGALNPHGLGVYNTIDEPAGLKQGIQRTKNLGLNPKFAGASAGLVPNFAPFEYNTKAGVRPVNPYVQEQITNILTKYKAQLEKGNFLQGDFNKELGDAIKQYRLTDKTSAEVNRRLEQSKQYYYNKEQSLFAPKTRAYDPLTGLGQGGGQLEFNLAGRGEPKQGEFIPFMAGGAGYRPITGYEQYGKSIGPSNNEYLLQKQQDAKNKFFAADSARRSANPFSFSDKRPSEQLGQLNSLQSPKLQNSVRFGELQRIFTGGIKTIGAELFKRGFEPQGGTEESLKKTLINSLSVKDREMVNIIESQKGQLLNEAKQKSLMGSYNRLNSAGGMFNMMSNGLFSKSGRADINSLKKENPELFNQLKQSSAGKAMTASFVLPFLGAALQQAMGTGSKAERGLGQLGQGVANTASYAATGFGLGGPLGAAAGGILGAVTEAPRIYKAFTDNTPELEQEMQKLKEVVQKTSESFGSIIDVSDKLYKINTGQITNATVGQRQQLQKEQSRLLLSSPNQKISNKIIDLMQTGDIAGAQGLAQSTVNKQANILEQSQIEMVLKAARENSKLRLGENASDTEEQRRLSILRRSSFASGDLAAKRQDTLNSPERTAELERYGSMLRGSVLSSLGESGEQFISIISKNQEEYNKLISDAKTTEDKIKAIVSFGAKYGVVVKEGALKEAARLNGGSLLDSFNQQPLDDYQKSLERINNSFIRSAVQFSKLDDILFEAQRDISKLGEGIERDFIKRLSNISLSFGNQLIALNENEQINSFRNNPYTSNTTNYRQTLLDAGQSRATSIEELKNSGQQGLRQIYSENIIKQIEAQAEKIKQGGLYGGAEEDLDKKVQDSINDIKKAFVDGYTNFSDESIGVIMKNFEKLRDDTQLISKMGGFSANLMDLMGRADDKGNINLKALAESKDNSQAAQDARFFLSGEYSPAYQGAPTKALDYLRTKLPINSDGITTKSDVSNLLGETAKAQLFNNSYKEALQKAQELDSSLKIQKDKIEANYKLSSQLGFSKYSSQGRVLDSQQNFRLRDIETQRSLTNDFTNRTAGRELSAQSRLFGLDIKSITATPGAKIGIDIRKAQIEAETQRANQLDSFTNGKLKELASQGIVAGSSSDLQQQLGARKTQISELKYKAQQGIITKEDLDRIQTLKGEINQIETTQKEISAEQSNQNTLYDIAITKSRQLSEQEKERLKIQLAFVEDRASALSNFNEQQARMGNFSDINFKDSFLSEWEYGTKDFYKKLAENNQEFARDFKGSVKAGFLEFANGTKDAKNALRDTGIAIATNLFNRTTSMGIDSLFGAISSGLGAGSSSFLQGFGTQKFNGGLIPHKYATGGLVSGGSGIRDDVPAALQPGSFVMRKNMTSRYGGGVMDALNSGAIPKFASGGIMNPFNSKKQLKKGIKSANYKPSDYFQPRAITTSSGIDIALNNQYEYLGIDTARPTSGRFDVSSMLSNFGRTDENNTQNQIKYAREAAQISYSESYKDYIKQQKEQMAQFEAGQNQRLYSAAISAFFQIGGGALSQWKGSSTVSNPQAPSSPTAGSGSGPYDLGTSGMYTNAMYSYPNSSSFAGTLPSSRMSFGYYKGGLIPRKFSTGGFSGLDRTPALLTAGEYVINKNAVDYYGSNFLNKVNMGVVPPRELRGYQTGGVIGRGGINSIGVTDSLLNYEQQMSEVISKLTLAIENLQKLFGNNNVNNKQGKIATESQAITINNNITINKATGETRATTQASATGNTDQQDKEESKRMGEAINAAVLKAIQQQLRPGGMIKESVGRR